MATPDKRWEQMINPNPAAKPTPNPAAIGADAAGTGDPSVDRPDFSKPYRAFGHQRPDALRSLWIYFNAAERAKYKKKKIQIQYEHLDSDDPEHEGLAADGLSFSFVVSGARQRMRITVHGIQLEEGYDYLTMHRMPWMRSHEKGRNFGQNDGPVITSIAIELLEEEGEAADGRENYRQREFA